MAKLELLELSPRKFEFGIILLLLNFDEANFNYYSASYDLLLMPYQNLSKDTVQTIVNN